MRSAEQPHGAEKEPALPRPAKNPVAALPTVLLIACTILCFVVVIRAALNLDVGILGYRLFYVASGSMEPTLPVHSLLIVKESREYQVGDIVTFYSKDTAISGRPNTHRIIAKDEGTGQPAYLTQGDANPSPDADTITDADIIGKVCFSLKSPGIFGTLVGVLSTRLGFFLLVLIPILLVAVSCMRDFRRALREELEQDARQSIENDRDGPSGQ